MVSRSNIKVYVLVKALDSCCWLNNYYNYFDLKKIQVYEKDYWCKMFKFINLGINTIKQLIFITVPV